MANPRPASRRSGVEPDTRFVYFIEAEGLSVVKIGVADDPNKRLRTLQVGSPVRLVLKGVFATDDAHRLESGFHITFAADRIHGEWFRITDAIRDIMEGGFDEAGKPSADNKIQFNAQAVKPGWNITEFGIPTDDLVAEAMSVEGGGELCQAVADLANLIARGRSADVLKRKAPWQWRAEAERLGL